MVYCVFKNNTGRINKENLRDVCVKFNLPADDEYIEALMSACNPDPQTGEIDYYCFINFLNWKDKMPDGLPKRDSKWWLKCGESCFFVCLYVYFIFPLFINGSSGW